MVGFNGMICLTNAMWLLVAWVILVLCLGVWYELVAGLGVCGFVIMLDWLLDVCGMVMLCGWLLLGLGGLTMLLGFVMLWVGCWTYDDEARRRR